MAAFQGSNSSMRLIGWSAILGERYVEHRVSWGDEVVIEGGSIPRVEGGQAGGVAELPLVGEPRVEVAGGPSGEVHEELGEVELRIDIMPAAGGREAGEDGGSAATAQVPDEQGVFAVQHHALHLALADVVIDGHRAV